MLIEKCNKRGEQNTTKGEVKLLRRQTTMKRNEINENRMVVRERERESKRVEKTCSICDAQKCAVVEKNEGVNNWGVKLDNIKLGYGKIAECF